MPPEQGPVCLASLPLHPQPQSPLGGKWGLSAKYDLCPQHPARVHPLPASAPFTLGPASTQGRTELCLHASFTKARALARLEQLMKKDFSMSPLTHTTTPFPVGLQELKITTCVLFYTEKRKCGVYFVTFTIFENLNFFHMYF